MYLAAEFDGFLHMDDVADLLPTSGHEVVAPVRIRKACFFDGEESRWIVQFFWLSGGVIARACYDRRTTETRVSFVRVASEEHRVLSRMFEAQSAQRGN